jgi:hypothetical protein
VGDAAWRPSGGYGNGIGVAVNSPARNLANAPTATVPSRRFRGWSSPTGPPRPRRRSRPSAGRRRASPGPARPRPHRQASRCRADRARSSVAHWLPGSGMSRVTDAPARLRKVSRTSPFNNRRASTEARRPLPFSLEVVTTSAPKQENRAVSSPVEMWAAGAGRKVGHVLVFLVGDAGPAKPGRLGPSLRRVPFSRPWVGGRGRGL